MSKRKRHAKKPERTSVVEPEQAHRIAWRGKMLAPGVYRGFCCECGTHVERSTAEMARRLDLLCRYCFDEKHPPDATSPSGADEDVGEAVREIMESNARRLGVPSGPLDDESGYQANAIGHMEDA